MAEGEMPFLPGVGPWSYLQAIDRMAKIALIFRDFSLRGMFLWITRGSHQMLFTILSTRYFAWAICPCDARGTAAFAMRKLNFR
jgi:hypothetical protein